MSDYRDLVHALIDPEQTEGVIGGTLQHVSVIISDGPSSDPQPRRPPAVCTLRPCEARELAFELLVLAEQAERIGSQR
jgi:hypothetical protein